MTARHVIQGNKVNQIVITEPVGRYDRGSYRNLLKGDIYDRDTQPSKTGEPPSCDEQLFRHSDYHRPLEIAEGPYFASDDRFDVAVFRVRTLHAQAAAIRLGVHFDDWAFRNIWQLSEAIILGYPPIPMVDKPILVAARADIHTFVVPYHVPAVHFILSATPRGGFSGGVAIHENGDALGVITSLSGGCAKAIDGTLAPFRAVFGFGVQDWR